MKSVAAILLTIAFLVGCEHVSGNVGVNLTLAETIHTDTINDLPDLFDNDIEQEEDKIELS